MKYLILPALVACFSASANIAENIANNLTTQDTNGKVYVNNTVKTLLLNDGLFVGERGDIELEQAVQATQSKWFNKEWQHAANKEDLAKSQRIANGNKLLKKLHRSAINPEEQTDLIIAHGGVLPSAIKMFLATKIAYDKQGVRKLVVVNGSEDFNLKMIRKSSVQDYAKAAEILGSSYQFQTITDENKPMDGKQVAQFVHDGFRSKMPELKVEYIDKKDLASYAQKIDMPTRITIAASYPQLEAHLMTFAALNEENKNFDVVSGITAGEQPTLEVLYDTQSPEEKYNFERNNFARILFRIAQYLKK